MTATTAPRHAHPFAAEDLGQRPAAFHRAGRHAAATTETGADQ